MDRPRPPKFLTILEDVCRIEQSERKARGNTELRHHPSSASFKKANGTVVGACLRAIFYRTKNIPETDPKDVTKFLTAGFGNAIHDWLADKLKKHPDLKVRSEVKGTMRVDPLTKEVSYRIDNLVIDNGELGGLEVKTVQSHGLQKMLRDGGPKEADLLQVLSYFATDTSIRWFSLLYVARDSAYRAEFHVYRDPDDGNYYVEGITPVMRIKPIQELNFAGIVSRWRDLEGYVERDELPPRDYKAVLRDNKFVEKRTKNHVEYKSAFNCVYCTHRSLCWNDTPGAAEDSVNVVGG